MPDQAPKSWSRLGRLLPRDVRERIFEPAFHDLFADGAHRRSGFALRVLLMTADCARVGMAAVLFRRGRPTRAGWAVLLLGSISVALGVLAGSVGNYHQPPG